MGCFGSNCSFQISSLRCSSASIRTDCFCRNTSRAHNYSERKFRVLVVSGDASNIATLPSVLTTQDCAAIGSLSFRRDGWAYEDVVKDALEFQPNVLLFCKDCNASPVIDDLDLPSRLLLHFPQSTVLITEEGDRISVRESLADYLFESRHRHYFMKLPLDTAQFLLAVTGKIPNGSRLPSASNESGR